MVTPAARKRGGESDVPCAPTIISDQCGKNTSERAERALEQGLEESMAGSDPPSIVQPGKNFTDSK
jgi:hypothetical protein